MRDLQTSRRAALFGAIAATGALVGSAAAAILPSPSANDVRLAELADALDRTLAKTDHALDDHQDAKTQYARLEEADATLAAMTALPADTLAGCGSKARAYIACDEFDTQNTYQLGMSLARDVLRIDGVTP